MKILEKFFKRKKAQQDDPRGSGDQPGFYLYEEKPLGEFSGQTEEVDYSAIPSFESQEPGLVKNLRRDLTNIDNMKKVLAIHISQFEEDRLQVQQLIETVEEDYNILSNISSKVVVSMARATALMDKIRSGLETTGLLSIRYKDLIFSVQTEIEKRKLYIQHSSEPFRATGYSDVMVFDQFVEQYSEGKNPEEYKNFKMALKRAWFRYRDAHSQIKEFEVKYLRRYSQAREDLEVILNDVASLVLDINNYLSLSASSLESWVLLFSTENDNFLAEEPQTRAAQIQEQPGFFPPQNVPREQRETPPEQPRPQLPVSSEFEKAPEIPEEIWQRLPNSGRIRYAAVYNQLIRLTYLKQGDPPRDPETEVIKDYIVEPYSYRVKRPENKGGQTTWYFFGFDTQDFQIKAYIVSRIQDVEVLNETFSPQWQIEFNEPAGGRWR